jgi:anti-sigma regulatory factor (Ser/Thr protein kinase)
MGWGLGELVPTLQVAVGEVFTNAVCHGAGPIEVVVADLADRVRIEVRDRGGGRPAIRPVQTSGPEVGGWGLRLVDELVDSWGTDVTAGYTTVWVEHAIPARPI